MVKQEPETHRESPRGSPRGSPSEFPSPARNSGTPPAAMECIPPKALPPNYPLIHVCLYCGVKFSSPNTLQAHVAFYCSKKPSPEALASLAASMVHPQANHSPQHSPGSTTSSTHSLKRTADMVMKEEATSPPSGRGTSPTSPDLPVLHQVTSLSPRPPQLRSPASSVHSNGSNSGNSSTISGAHRNLSPPAHKAAKTSSQAFSCHLCAYTCDKRSTLNRHVKVHDDPERLVERGRGVSGSPPTLQLPKERVPLSQLYCHECDIQFRSRTTFAGHKEMYCEARRRNQGARNVQQNPAHGAGPSGSSPGRSSSSPAATPPTLSPRGLGGHAASSSPPDDVPGPVSPQRAALMAQAAVNSIMQQTMNQAMSQSMNQAMNQAALVMAPIVGPNGMTYNIPTVIMHPFVGGGGLGSSGAHHHPPMALPPPPPPSLPPHSLASQMGNTVIAHSSNNTSPKAGGKSSGSSEQPLDLSVKKEDEEDGTRAVKREKPDDAAMSQSTPIKSPAVSPPVHQASSSSDPPPPPPVPILIQPTPRHINKCNECNIVFYKMENYIAHKEHYCSARHSSPPASLSPPVIQAPFPQVPVSTSSIKSSPPLGQNQSPLPPPTSQHLPHPLLMPPHLLTEANFFQFYCMPCKIKFSSRDTLEAHQGFYCPSRKMGGESTATEAGEITGGGGMVAVKRNGSSDVEDEGTSAASSDREQLVGYLCSQCQGRFPSARLLRVHLCPAAASVPVALFRCSYCEFIAQSEGRLIEHIKAHAPSKAYRCTLCGYRGNTVRGMRMHGKTHIDAGEIFTDDNMLEFEEPPLIPKRMKSVQGQGHDPHNLSAVQPQHVDIEGEILRLKNQPYKRRRSTKMYMYAEHARKHRCDDCNAWFMTADKLAAHLKVHEEEELQQCLARKCSSCNYVADNEEMLLWHMQLHGFGGPSENSTSNSSETTNSSGNKETVSAASTSRKSNEMDATQVKAEPKPTREEDEKIDVEETDMNEETDEKEETEKSPQTPPSRNSPLTKSSDCIKTEPDSPDHAGNTESPDNTSDTENHHVNNTAQNPPKSPTNNFPVKIQNGGSSSSHISSSRPTTPLSPSPAMNATTIRPKLATPDMTAILVPKNEKPETNTASSPMEVRGGGGERAAVGFGKQWGSNKCNECNITFHKIENYLAHKEHYCSGRRSSSVY